MKSKVHHPIVRITLVISIALYLASLTQECYCTSMICGGHWRGYAILGLGALGGIMSIAGLTWYANPLVWVAWSQLYKNHPNKALIFSILATVFATGFLLFEDITDITPGRPAAITAYRIGYWLWLASMVTTLAGSIFGCFTKAAFGKRLNQVLVLQVDFNLRCNGGVRLTTKGSVYRYGKKKIKLQNNQRAIIWDKDVHNSQQDNLAVEALILYSRLDNSWIASFNYDDLKHESERSEPLLED